MADQIIEFFKPFQREINVDNTVFKLHHTVTVALLLVFSTALGIEQYVGDPIDCMDGNDAVDTYCWVAGTFTYKTGGITGKSGEIEHLQCDFKNPDNNCWRHMYVPWVTLILLSQIAFFVAPKYIWEFMEGGKVEAYVTGLTKKSLIRGLQSSEDLNKNEQFMKMIHVWKNNIGKHDFWAIKFYFCEVLQLLNIFVQYYFLNYIFDGQFRNVAEGGLEADLHQSVLPVTTQCEFKVFGRADVESKSYLCVLPMNMVNQKVFGFLYFWLGILLACSMMMLTVRIFWVISSTFRELYLKFFYQIKDLNTNIVKRTSHGDFFLLTLILDNTNSVVSAQLVQELGKQKIFDPDMF